MWKTNSRAVSISEEKMECVEKGFLRRIWNESAVKADIGSYVQRSNENIRDLKMLSLKKEAYR